MPSPATRTSTLVKTPAKATAGHSWTRHPWMARLRTPGSVAPALAPKTAAARPASRSPTVAMAGEPVLSTWFKRPSPARANSTVVARALSAPTRPEAFVSRRSRFIAPARRPPSPTFVFTTSVDRTKPVATISSAFRPGPLVNRGPTACPPNVSTTASAPLERGASADLSSRPAGVGSAASSAPTPIRRVSKTKTASRCRVDTARPGPTGRPSAGSSSRRPDLRRIGQHDAPTLGPRA